jgi:hypothetical protein
MALPARPQPSRSAADGRIDIYRHGMPDDDGTVAVAWGGPLDGTPLGPADADRYEVRMADKTVHLYLRSDKTVPHGVVFHHAGRI